MSTDTDMAATAFDFSGLFEDGHAPGETLPGAPRTEPGTLIDRIYHRVEGHTLTVEGALTGEPGRLLCTVEPPKSGMPAKVYLRFIPAGHVGREDVCSARVYLPHVSRGRGEEFVIDRALLSSSGPLMTSDQVQLQKGLLGVAADLAEQLDRDAPVALTPELEATQAQWDAGAAKRAERAVLDAQILSYYNAVRDALAVAGRGARLRVMSSDHPYRTTGMLGGYDERTFNLALPRGSRGKAEQRFWNLLELEVERDGKFEAVTLPERPQKPEGLA